MPNKLTNALFHIVPATMLFAALGHWRYGYYMLLRVVVTAAAALLTAFAYQRTSTFSVWIGLFLVVAAVFNPIVPLHLTRGAWSILNIAAAALFVGHFVVDRHKGKQKDGICPKAE
jgi:hypothetical protein